MRLLTTQTNGVHHLTVPRHSPLRVGILAAIVTEVAGHLALTRDEVAARLFG